MATLIVRRLEPEIVLALKMRAARSGRTAEAEHRALLRSLLTTPARRSLADVLEALPGARWRPPM